MSLFVHLVLCTLRLVLCLGVVMGIGAMCYLATVHENILVTLCSGIMVGFSILAVWIGICHTD